jgi:hypothetical protein
MEVMMAPPTMTVAMKAVAPAMDFLNQRRRTNLVRYGSDRSRHRRTRHQAQRKRACNGTEHCYLPHFFLPGRGRTWLDLIIQP